MKYKPRGWRNEPYRHAMAAHGLKSSGRYYSDHNFGRDRVNLHGMSVSRWRCPHCYRGLHDGMCILHGRIHDQDRIDIYSSPEAQRVAVDIRIWDMLKKHPDITIQELSIRMGIDEITLWDFLNKASDPVDGSTYLQEYRRAYPLKSK